MKLENTFTVAAPLERTWATLLDIERVAGCLPGATIEPAHDDGVFRGAMKIKLGPMVVDYRGTARLQDVDEDTHTASIAVQAREAHGSGTAAAVISNRLEPHDGATRIVAETDLSITGRQAQFGRGIMEDVAQTMMGEFAKRLESEIQRGEGPAAPPPVDAPDEVLDVGGVLANTTLVRRGGIAGAVLLVVLALLALARGRRRQLVINVNFGR